MTARLHGVFWVTRVIWYILCNQDYVISRAILLITSYHKSILSNQSYPVRFDIYIARGPFCVNSGTFGSVFIVLSDGKENVISPIQVWDIIKAWKNFVIFSKFSCQQSNLEIFLKYFTCYCLLQVLQHIPTHY